MCNFPASKKTKTNKKTKEKSLTGSANSDYLNSSNFTAHHAEMYTGLASSGRKVSIKTTAKRRGLAEADIGKVPTS